MAAGTWLPVTMNNPGENMEPPSQLTPLMPVDRLCIIQSIKKAPRLKEIIDRINRGEHVWREEIPLECMALVDAAVAKSNREGQAIKESQRARKAATPAKLAKPTK